MNKSISKLVSVFYNDVNYFDNTEGNNKIDNEAIIEKLNSIIEKVTYSYFATDNESQKESTVDLLSRYYNLLYYYKSKQDYRKMYLIGNLEKLPMVYIINQKPERFEIDYDLLSNIDISRGLSYSEAEELLKWTVNNTRDNLNLEESKRTGNEGGVYDNSSLGGACGFSQFSTLFPLQRLGLKVTINNTSAVNAGRHAYGTVLIPIKDGEKLVEKRFLIDCTYRQFFTIPYNVVARYISAKPDVGFFVKQNEEETKFAKDLLKNGFVEATQENLELYLKPFFATSIPINQVGQIDSEFSKLNIMDIIDNHQEEFDYSHKEFREWGLNLDISKAKHGKNKG